MSHNSSFVNTMVKVGAAALLLHIAYKVGKKAGLKEKSHEPNKPYVPPFSDFQLSLPKAPKPRQPKLHYPEYDFVYEEDEVLNETQDEINYVQGLIDELRQKRAKTPKDKYNIDLLEIKLKQLKSKK